LRFELNVKSHFLNRYPTLLRIVDLLDNYLKETHPSFFGPKATHPILPIKRSKILHDSLWGTNKYYWRELVIIDSPIYQRLRDIHQVGLSYQVFMSARHTRFEHSIGVVTTASRVFDALLSRNRGQVQDIFTDLYPGNDFSDIILRLKQELRLAALLHDIGHSLHSHTSELVYENLSLMKSASKELTQLVGKEKGAAETISFCLTLTKSLPELLNRAQKKLTGDVTYEDYSGEIDLVNVALMIVGRSAHPFLQFMGDIISSGFDADKLDYLLRDATNAGLPLRYDLDRYLFSVNLERNILVDGEGVLKNLYDSVATIRPTSLPPSADKKYSYFETYRLRLPATAMNTIEQIVICKLMLFSYIYHHQKVRASESMLQKMLEKIIKMWCADGNSDEKILERFLDMTDSSLHGYLQGEATKAGIYEYAYRLIYRLLPREVYCLNGAAATHAERPILGDFLTDLQDRAKKLQRIKELEQAIGQELLKVDSTLGKNVDEVLVKTGIWVDVPKPPKFEDVDELVMHKTNNSYGVPLKDLFPIGEWTEAYTHYRYPVRIFSFSEYYYLAMEAAKSAMQKVIKIQAESFYTKVMRIR
jgi:HD superfamily phosphohydrolase